MAQAGARSSRGAAHDGGWRWHGLPERVDILQYRLRASMPVRAADGGSQVYLYYQPDKRSQSDSTQLIVTGS